MQLLARPGAGPVPTILATALPDGSVRCGVCAHRCLVRPGRRGICGVRENRDGVLRCLAYGAVAAAGLDPIEKKPLFHVDPGSLAYSIATVGCPFHCTFCQNWEIAQAPRLGLDIPQRPMTPQAVVAEARRTAQARSPTRTSSPLSSWSTPSTPRGLRERMASATSSSPMATRHRKLLTSSHRSSMPPTWT
jgi:hypothetical protein